MAVTTKGITYPTSSDNIAPLETHFANLANTSDNAGIVSGEYTFTGPASSGTSASITVALPITFATVPKVLSGVAYSPSGSAYVSNVYAVTTSQFVAKIYRISGTGAESLKLTWFASTYA